MKVLIVGAGVAGLGIGWRLAQHGADVEILERGVAGRGATWASAGMIAPGAEQVHATSAMSAFAREARVQWPAFARELEAASGRSISYREAGSLIVAETPERARALEMRVLADHAVTRWLSRAQLCEREPLLSRELLGGLWLAEDAQVDNRALTDALCIAVEKAGGRLRENCEVHALVHEDCIHAVATPNGLVPADAIVLACGAWMNLIVGVRAGELPSVKPVKGQMIACEPPAGLPLPNSPIWADDIYLVPREGRLFIGATVEDASFDTSISHEARDFLLGAAKRLIPSLGLWRVAEMWAGLRPRTGDDAPVLGATAIPGLYVASGQFRNGILFAPSVADMLSRLVVEGRPPSGLDAFDPRRFHTL